MHDIIKFLKKAVKRGAVTPTVANCYIVRQSGIYVRNESMQAGVNAESGVEFNVPAEEFEAALARMNEVQSLNYDGQSVTVRAGRLKATIQCIDGEPPDMPALPNVWSTTPPNLIKSLKAALPFIADTSWASGIRLKTGKVTAINNASGIDIELPELELETECNMPSAVAEFLADQELPAEYSADGSAIMFRWADGRWLRAQCLVTSFPDMVDKIFTDAGEDAPIEVTEDWRAAYADASALSDGMVMLTPQAVGGTKGAGQSRVEIETPLSAGHTSYWRTKYLDPVIAFATHWNPESYPNPSLFIAPGIRGVVIGVRR